MMLLHLQIMMQMDPMTMIFQLHFVAVHDEYNFSRCFSILKIVFINSILHLQICFIVHITFFLLLPMVLLLVGISLLTPIFCTTTSITTVPVSVFWVIFIHSSQLQTNNQYNSRLQKGLSFTGLILFSTIFPFISCILT